MANIVEHDALTNKTEVRSMTEAELAQRKLDEEAAADRHNLIAEIAAAKTSAHAKLKTLGLTDQEIAALVG